MDKTEARIIAKSWLENNEEVLALVLKYEEFSGLQREKGKEFVNLTRNKGDKEKVDVARFELDGFKNKKKETWAKIIEILNNNKKKLQEIIKENDSE